MSGAVHHVELWVEDLAEAKVSWGWLLVELGWTLDQSWESGCSWSKGDIYIVATRPPAIANGPHDRRAPGMNHLALHGGSTKEVDRLVMLAPEHGWQQLYAERYPHAGGLEHYAAYLENSAGFKAELVAESRVS